MLGQHGDGSLLEEMEAWSPLAGQSFQELLAEHYDKMPVGRKGFSESFG